MQYRSVLILRTLIAILLITTAVKKGAIFFRGKTGKYAILAVSHGRGIPMNTKEREKLIADAVAKFEAGLRSKAEQFEATHAERKLTVSVIEKLWGESRKLSDEIVKQVYTELTNAGEEKLAREKKPRSTQRE
jgi:hypothetical protein